MSPYVLGFHDIDKTKHTVVGGKGANLGELARIEGIRVPDGFCISTAAFKRVMGETPALKQLLDQLSLLKMEDRDKIGELSGEMRRVIEEIAIPQDISEEIIRHLLKLGEKNAYAVRSSATAEDLPTASFAGQQDTYLNIIGEETILKHVSKCWASLFTERAVTYRLQNGFDHRNVYLSVVVQKMVFPQAAGILFTADPVTSNRKVLSIDAGFGLGEALAQIGDEESVRYINKMYPRYEETSFLEQYSFLKFVARKGADIHLPLITVLMEEKGQVMPKEIINAIEGILARYPQEEVPSELLQALDAYLRTDIDAINKYELLVLLGRYRNQEIYRLLIKYLEPDQPLICMGAAEGLGLYGNPEALPILVQLKEKAGDPDLAETIERSISKLKQQME